MEKVETQEQHVDIIVGKNKIRYVKARWVGSNEVLSDPAPKPKAEWVFDAVDVQLEPVEFDVTDRAALDAEACGLLDLEPHQLFAEMPDPYGSMKSAIAWAVNYELGTAALCVFYPDTVEEARKVEVS